LRIPPIANFFKVYFYLCNFFAAAQKSHQKTPPLLKKLLKINSLR